MHIQRQLSSQLKKLVSLYPILSVSGPRQSGKTTLVREVFPDYAYVNLERLDDRLAAEEDPRRFLERDEGQGLIIDEAQKVPALFSYLQVLVDERGTMGQFVLTGSQNFLLLEQVSQSLAGRVALHMLLPFSQQELAASPDLSLDESLFKGGYPVLYDRGVAPPDYYPAYIQTYVERDVRSLRNIGDLSASPALFAGLCWARRTIARLERSRQRFGDQLQDGARLDFSIGSELYRLPALSASRKFFQGGSSSRPSSTSTTRAYCARFWGWSRPTNSPPTIYAGRFLRIGSSPR